MNARIAGAALLGAGFLFGAYVVVEQVHAVDWTRYAMAAAAMLAGLVCSRVGRRPGEDDHARHVEDIAVLKESLERLIAKVSELNRIEDERELLAVHRRIDGELMEPIGAFVDARESMIPRLGMQRYADIMSPFATGERLLNRAWSASVDGYVDEVRTCLREALSELQSARERLLDSDGSATSP